ncbi:MAG: uracil phosphoribosyltransferase [Spirochaetaceae bacterium]|jgi:uracil phosphoribosyltransferase|nr:uracil phosphoribosyltransferase [Spirochaetaceae bacterium]
MAKVVLKATDLDGFLSEHDKEAIGVMDKKYGEVTASFARYGTAHDNMERGREEKNLVRLYNEMGKILQDICKDERYINVYSFKTPHESHAEASRLIAKLRDIRTDREEFVYYVQRAYELLFNFAWGGSQGAEKNHLIIKTPVTVPVQNYAVHKIPNIDSQIENTVMCVLLRGALLPSIIMSKEIEEYSSQGYITPFALFRIKRDETKKENNMEYILDLDRSYIDISHLDGKDLIFADPMNATGGSLVTVVQYLMKEGVRPRGVHFFNAISALKGALRVVRAIPNCSVWTLWMDPVLNEAAYILPGLGDAGDRINGKDEAPPGRNILQLIADYGSNITGLYRSQLREIEDTVLGRQQ